ncbi:MAG: epimerase [Pseudomonadota bacterium]
MTDTVLILGANGRFGRNAKDAFLRRGWAVRTFDRTNDNLTDAAKGVDVIVNGWNPSYEHWASEIPGQVKAVIKAARANAATVIIPGNVYVFGINAPDRFAHDTPQAAENPLGRIRIKMEAAYRESGVQTIVLRAGDFIDTAASGNWFDRVMAKPLAKGRFVYPGNPDIPHAWAYLPDMATATVRLAEMRDKLGTFEDIPFPGYALTGRAMAKLIGDALGRPIKLKQMSWLPIHLARPFWGAANGILEMRYLWSKPHVLDDQKFKSLLPDFRHTAPKDALSMAIGALNIHPNEPVARRALSFEHG